MEGAKVGWFCPEYKYLSPSYDYLVSRLYPVMKRQNKGEKLLKLISGGEIEFWTLDNEDAGRSRSYDWVIIDEASLVKNLRSIWELAISPTLLDRRGKAMMGGTPKGIDAENYFYVACTDKTLLDGWKEFHAPTRSNPTLDPIGVANLVNENPPLVYQQEFLAEFVDWSGEAFFSLDSLLEKGQPVDYPKVCDTVFAVIDTATKTGREHDGTAVTYFAYTRYPQPKLVVLDWDLVQIEGSLLERWLPNIFDRLKDLAAQCKARMGSIGANIEDKASGMVLLQQARRHGWPARAINSKLTSLGKDERAVSVSGYVWRGLVKLSRTAHDKVISYKGMSANHLRKQVIGFHVGVDQIDDDLLDTFCYGIAIALGDSAGF